MKIVVAGYGPVGQAMFAALEKHKDVDLYIDDPYLEGYNFDNSVGDPPDGVVVCVATPMGDDGFCTTQNVEDVFNKYGSDVKYLVKSTTDPMFIAAWADRVDLTFSPEYLRGTTGANPTEEFLNSEFAVYGGGSMRWWHELLKPVLPKLKDVRFMTAPQAAFAKYFLNCFLATKVTFFNQAYEIFKKSGCENFDIVIDGLCLDPRVGMSHTQVPGPDGMFGYGGHCFPKDMSALARMGEDIGANVEFLDDVIKANDRYRYDMFRD